MPKKIVTPWPPQRVESASGDAEATVDVLPVVHHPDVARRADREIGLHLQAAAHVAAGRRDLVAGLDAGRAVLGADAAELHDRTARPAKLEIQTLSLPSTSPPTDRGDRRR